MIQLKKNREIEGFFLIFLNLEYYTETINSLDCEMTLRRNLSGREKEATLLKRSNQAAAAARLMLREIHSWEEFLEPSTTDYSTLPRRQLKSGKNDIKKRLNKEIKIFCSKNFQGFTESTLSKLYEDIKAHRGLELPLKDFESTYGKVNPTVIKGNPSHLTVHISLWGLQFLFPEDILTKDIVVSLDILQKSEKDIEQFKEKSHYQLSSNQDKIKEGIRQKEFAQRAIILCSFNLMEAFLNGIAWDYCQNYDISKLSKRKQNLLTDSSSASIRDKLLKYPNIVSGSEFPFAEKCELFLGIIKPFRDSLVHPSPFSAPEKFGGYDKLRKIYDLNEDVAIQAVVILIEIISSVFEHIYGAGKKPVWLNDLKEKQQEYQNNGS